MPWKKHIPNFLTSTRIVLAGLFPWVPMSVRPWIVIGALITEYFDGALSRWLHAQTLLGQILDPIADKLFFLSVVITFCMEYRLALGDVVLLGIRDISVAVVSVYLILRGRGALIAGMKPKFFGKLTTAFQYLAFFNLVFLGYLNPVVLTITTVIGVLASIQYLHQFHSLKRERKEELGQDHTDKAA